MDEFSLEVRELRRVYAVPVREAGLRAAIRGLWKREEKEVVAVADVSFKVKPGEIVGFLGPNGAGKTTTLKVLSGLLHPTAGEVRVMGFEPFRRDPDFLRRITLVMGNRNQLHWDLPSADTFEVYRVIYQIDPEIFRKTLGELVELLELGDLMTKPVRNLSLGERMKCEIAGALLHRPQVLFLDEPTIGLDVTMQRRIRDFIREYNKRTSATILLTSHYMADVEALCDRVVIIDRGRILFDGLLAELVRSFSPHKTISLELENGNAESASLRESVKSHLARYGETVLGKDGRLRLRVSKGDTARVTGELLSRFAIKDLTVEEPPIEEVIEQAFAGRQPS